jgi:hypothetical protein
MFPLDGCTPLSTLKKLAMSASLPKADIGGRELNVRFVPKADIGVSFDDFVGTGRYWGRNRDIIVLGLSFAARLPDPDAGLAP